MKINFYKLLFCLFLFFPYSLYAQEQLPKWKNGYLDIHHISTGRGNAAYITMPDGTTMLIDMGELEMMQDNDRRAKPKPNSSKSAAEWVKDYIYQFAPNKTDMHLDYAVLTHFDDDHIGNIESSKKIHIKGNYPQSGITDLGSIIPIHKLVDRGYDFPIDISLKENVSKYKIGEALVDRITSLKRFVAYQAKENGLKYEKIQVGNVMQFIYKFGKQPSNFQVMPLFANGQIKNTWDNTIGTERFKRDEYPGENPLSLGLKISYGKFDYYTGGDINGINYLGQGDFSSMESMVAPVVGPVDVAILNHHGNRDSQNEYFIRNIRPRVWIGQSWSASQPGEEVFRRLSFTDIYPGERDLFTTFRHLANDQVVGRRGKASIFKATQGHIVVRVYPNGEKYDVFVLNDQNKTREIIAKFSYTSR